MRQIQATNTSTGQIIHISTRATTPQDVSPLPLKYQDSTLLKTTKNWPTSDAEILSDLAGKAIHQTVIHLSTPKNEQQIVLQHTITSKNNVDDASTPIYALNLAYDTSA